MKYLFLIFLYLLSQSTIAQLDSLREVIESKPNDKETVDWIHKTINNYWRSDPKLMEDVARIALEISEEIGYEAGLAKANNQIGISFWARDMYQEATTYYLESMRLFREQDNLQGAATAAINLGTIFDELKQIENAKRYTLQGLRDLNSIGDSLAMSRAELNLGVIYFNEKKLDSALHYFDNVAAYRLQKKDTFGLALVHNNIAAVLEEMESHIESINNYFIARKLVKSDQKQLLNDIFNGLGHNYLILGQTDLGISYIDSALSMASETGQKHLEQVSYSHLKDHYLIKRNFQKAVEYLQKEYELDQEIRGDDVQKQIETLRAQYENEKKEKQLVLLENEKAQSEFQLIVAILTGVFILIAAILIIYTLRLRVRNSKLKQRELRDQLEQKNRELTSYALNFIQKNELMGELTDRINELKKTSDNTTAHELDRINRIVDNSFRIDQDWENFKVMFEEVHQGYLPALKEAYTELSNADLKLCALLRLNLNLKESSKILGISPDSVKIARYRLRKKLKLATEDNLIDFLILFDKNRNQHAVA